MTQQQLYVPAAAGWYACPGDPPQVTRHWDGKQWLCEIRGPIRDHFDHLRALSVQGMSPEDQAVLRQLTAEVSRIEDLVLAAPTSNPPLVAIAAPPPYVPPPVDPYTSVPLPAHGMTGSTLSSGGGSGKRFVASGRSVGGRRTRVVAVVAVVGVLALVVGWFASTRAGGLLAASPASLDVHSCVTLSYPSGATDSQDVTWAKAECKTPSGGPVSYTVISKLNGSAACDADSQYVQTLNGSKDIANTYCLMENLTVGQCLYEDDKGFYFDVACADSRAQIKVSTIADQGSGYVCPDGNKSWQFPAGNRTYCLTKP